MKNQPGGIVTKEMPIDVSQRRDLQPGRPRRPIASASSVLEDGRKVRFFKSNGEQIVCVKDRDMARLKEVYKNEIAPALMKQFGYKSPMEVPRITKITLNMGVGEATGDKKILDNAVGDMQKIAGQKPVVTKARKAIAGFKIREGYPIGCMVTLRQERMYEFLDRFVTIALPRVRDFRGISRPRVRRPRQLQHRRQGTDHLPGDRVRQDRRDPRDEHLDHDDREDRRRSQGAARRVPFPVQELGRHVMAKLALINRNEKRKKLVAKFAEEARRAAGDHRRPEGVGRDALRGAPQDPGAAAQRQPDARAQPLRADRPSARRVPQVRPRPQQASRVRDARRGARHRQGQLVKETEELTNEHDRSHRRHADAHPQRADDGKGDRRDAVFQGEDRDRQGAAGRGLHRRLQGRRRGSQAAARDRAALLRRPPGHREARARVASPACASTRARTTFRA